MIETVGELRKILEEYPEDLKVRAIVSDEGVFEFWIGKLQRVEKYEVKEKEGVVDILPWFLGIRIEKKEPLG